MTEDDYIFDPSVATRTRRDTSSWTIPMICVGIATIACCVLIPAADENRRLSVETRHLQADLDQIKHQIQINDQFLKSVADDPTLLERLAQRQMKMVRQGESVLDLKGSAAKPNMSPFLLLNLAPPEAMAAAEPASGVFSPLTERPRLRLFTMGGALLLMAAGLVLGISSRPE